MTTPIQSQTPVSTPPIAHGVGIHAIGTPVVAPTRSKDKEGASGGLGTFGVRLFRNELKRCVLNRSAWLLRAGQVRPCSDVEG